MQVRIWTRPRLPVPGKDLLLEEIVPTQRMSVFVRCNLALAGIIGVILVVEPESRPQINATPCVEAKGNDSGGSNSEPGLPWLNHPPLSIPVDRTQRAL